MNLQKRIPALATVFGLGMWVGTEYTIRMAIHNGASLTRPEWWGPVTHLNFVSIVLVALAGIGWVILDAMEHGVTKPGQEVDS